MLLEPLTDALTLVRDRIKNFEPEFTNNETQTRLSLVDPVLKALGWDPQDPTAVRVEYPVRQRNRNNIRADYALLGSGQEPVAFVEAKKLRSDLGDAHLQLFEYAVSESVPYAVATNGADWAIYKQAHQETGLLFQRLLRVSILDRTPTVNSIMLLSLWKELLTSHSSIDRIAPALSTLETHPLENALHQQSSRTMYLHDEPTPEDLGAASLQSNRRVLRHFSKYPSDGAYSEPEPIQEANAVYRRTDLTPEADSLVSTPHFMSGIPDSTPKQFRSAKISDIDPGDCETFTLNNPPDTQGRKPLGLILPDGTRIPIQHWTWLLKEVVMWLFDNGQLNVRLPWKGDRSFDRNVLQEIPFRNRNGDIYKQQVKITDDLYLLTNYSARNVCNAASKLLADCGVDNSRAQVTMVTENKHHSQ